MLNEEMYHSRFIKSSDKKIENLLYPIPEEWWSRKYEYDWASQFAEKEQVCLDAACGTTHHLKYFLATICDEVYACDVDPIILDKEKMMNLLKNKYSDMTENIDKLYDKIDFQSYNLKETKYVNKMFDVIYCISVLEHLSYQDMKKTFVEFRRILKDSGIIVLTFDYPLVNFTLLKHALQESGLKFYADPDFTIPEDVLKSDPYHSNLNCFRCVLNKTNG